MYIGRPTFTISNDVITAQLYGSLIGNPLEEIGSLMIQQGSGATADEINWTDVETHYSQLEQDTSIPVSLEYGLCVQFRCRLEGESNWGYTEVYYLGLSTTDGQGSNPFVVNYQQGEGISITKNDSLQCDLDIVFYNNGVEYGRHTTVSPDTSYAVLLPEGCQVGQTGLTASIEVSSALAYDLGPITATILTDRVTHCYINPTIHADGTLEITALEETGWRGTAIDEANKYGYKYPIGIYIVFSENDNEFDWSSAQRVSSSITTDGVIDDALGFVASEPKMYYKLLMKSGTVRNIWDDCYEIFGIVKDTSEPVPVVHLYTSPGVYTEPSEADPVSELKISENPHIHLQSNRKYEVEYLPVRVSCYLSDEYGDYLELIESQDIVVATSDLTDPYKYIPVTMLKNDAATYYVRYGFVATVANLKSPYAFSTVIKIINTIAGPRIIITDKETGDKLPIAGQLKIFRKPYETWFDANIRTHEN